MNVRRIGLLVVVAGIAAVPASAQGRASNQLDRFANMHLDDWFISMQCLVHHVIRGAYETYWNDRHLRHVYQVGYPGLGTPYAGYMGAPAFRSKKQRPAGMEGV